jgi:hypothetical protein
MASPLSLELKVACEIWHYQELGERLWFTKIVDSLAWCMDKKTISHSMDTLCDWGIICGEYSETEKGRVGRLFLIDTYDGADFRIRDLYEKYWKEERCQ